MLTYTGPVYETGSYSVIPDSPDNRAIFTFRDVGGQPVEMFRPLNLNRLRVPRQACTGLGIDLRSPGYDVHFENHFVPRNPEQARIVAESVSLLKKGQSHIIRAPTGSGKCLSPDTEVMFYDGGVVAAKDLCVGDLLMGPDSAPRTILSTISGRDLMYRITTTKGDTFDCNGPHILCLTHTTTRAHVNVSLDEYMTWSHNKKRLHKLWITGVNYPAQTRPFQIDPYFLGVLLSGGSMRECICVTTSEPEIVSEIYAQSRIWGLGVRVQDGCGCKNYFLTTGRVEDTANPITQVLIKLDLCGPSNTWSRKYIPDSYKYANRADRLSLIAGLLDTDGHLNKNCYGISSKSREMAQGIVQLCRSVGLFARVKQVVKTCKNDCVSVYHRVIISGHIDMIPCRVPRKVASPRPQHNSVSVFGFTVQPLGEGDYVGFELDGDRRFLLGNFLVTHNTVMGTCIISHLKKKALVIITKEDLASQWVEAIQKVLNIPPEKIGLLKGSTCRVSDYVDIAFIQTICKDGKFPHLDLSQYGLVLIDETHRLSGDKFQNAMWRLPGLLRLGLTATPYRTDKKDPVFFAHIGAVLVSSEAVSVPFKSFVYDTGITVPERIKHSFADSRYLMSWLSKLPSRNKLIAKKVISAYKRGHQCIVFSDFLDHLKHIRELTYPHIPAEEVSLYIGGLSKSQRELAKTKKVIFATYKMCSEGTDIPGASVGILTLPRANIEQIVGRILRVYLDKNESFVIDFSDRGSKVLNAFTNKRIKFYQNHANRVQLIKASHE